MKKFLLIICPSWFAMLPISYADGYNIILAMYCNMAFQDGNRLTNDAGNQDWGEYLLSSASTNPSSPAKFSCMVYHPDGAIMQRITVGVGDNDQEFRKVSYQIDNTSYGPFTQSNFYWTSFYFTDHQSHTGDAIRLPLNSTLKLQVNADEWSKWGGKSWNNTYYLNAFACDNASVPCE